MSGSAAARKAPLAPRRSRSRWPLALALCACGPRAGTPGATRVAATPSRAGTEDVSDDGPPPGSAGLLARIDDGRRVVVALVASPNFALLPGESLHPATGPAFAAEFTGEIELPEAGDYRFWASPAALEIGGRPVADGVPSTLPAGRQALRVRTRRANEPGESLVRLDWAGPGFAREPVPAARFHRVAWPPEAARWRRIDRGRALADDLGCRSCHLRGADVPGSDVLVEATRRSRGPSLTRAGQALQAGWVYRWLADPRALRADARMPHFGLDDPARADLTAFLMTLRGEGRGGVSSVGSDPDASPLPAELAGQARSRFERIGCTACHGEEGDRLPLTAVGSKFTPSGLFEVVVNPGRRGGAGRMPALGLTDAEGELFTRWLLAARRADLEGAPPPGDVARGRARFDALGCVACHATSREGLPLPQVITAPGFDALVARAGSGSAPGGCLTGTPRAGLPRFALSGADRAALALYLAEGADVSLAPSFELSRTLAARRCTACHALDGPAATSFEDHVPALTEVGHKLRPQWIDRMVRDVYAAPTRPWLSVRMPRYASGAPVGSWFAAVAGQPRTPARAPAPADEQVRLVQEGVQYLGQGEGGLSCVTCHRFGDFDPRSATPAPDLLTVTQRVRPEWFARWLADPLRITPGTQMPAFFAGVDPDFAAARIDALWAALSQGERMPTPIGVDLGERGIPLRPRDRPIIERTFVEGGPLRAIAVGLPPARPGQPGVSYVFDAETCRVTFAWSGGFLDMRPVWTGRGGEPARVLGQPFFPPPGASATGATDPAAALPGSVTAPGGTRPRFLGYTLDRRGLPTFECALGDLRVRQTLRDGTARPGAPPALERRIEVLGGRRPARARFLLAAPDAAPPPAAEGRP